MNSKNPNLVTRRKPSKGVRGGRPYLDPPKEKSTVEEIHKQSLKEWKKKCNCNHCPVIEYLYNLRDANAKK